MQRYPDLLWILLGERGTPAASAATSVREPLPEHRLLRGAIA